MKEQLISFETAVLAKEKGFNDYCTTYYDKHGEACESYFKINNDIIGINNVFCMSPTQSLLQKYLRERCNLHVDMYRNAIGYQCNLEKADSGTHIKIVTEDEEFTYEEALEAGLKEALSIIK